MEVIFTITILGALLTTSDSTFGGKSSKNGHTNHLSDYKITPLTGSDVEELMQQLTEILRELEDRDKENRKMVEELIGIKPRVKRQPCRGDVCDDGPSTVGSTISPSTLTQSVNEFTPTYPFPSTPRDNTETTTLTDPSTAWSTSETATINSAILTPTAPQVPPIPLLTNNGRCLNEPCPQKPFIYVPGKRGMAGEPGERGDRGDRGNKGGQGDLSGGDKGDKGANGPRGDGGASGFPGIKGEPGVVGTKGNRGQKGNQGQKGEMGEDTSRSSKTIYTRWGATNCPTTAELVFEGYAAGAAYNQKGGGTNYLCLPRQPMFNYYRNGVDNWRGYLYGSEYEENAFPPLVGKDNGDVPCAVCLVNDRSVVLMQPARTDCPDGWTREYFGYLMASAYIHYRSEWTCVDGNATLVSLDSLENSDGALFYPTEVCCGNENTGLPCDNYPNGYELTCSVCTR